jgi:hypothetical protein
MTEAAATAAIDRPRLGGVLLPLSERDFRLYWLGREVVFRTAPNATARTSAS